MLMRVIFGACLFGLGYYLGREAGRSEPNQRLTDADKSAEILNATSKWKDSGDDALL